MDADRKTFRERNPEPNCRVERLMLQPSDKAVPAK